jgi:chaperone required for assembly of F1-ATPase
MKRFWKAVDVRAAPDGQWGVMLDGRPVRTPGKNLLRVSSPALADAIAAEWDASDQDVDPRTMPFTGLSNAAIDRISPDPDAFTADLAKYAESDVLCYRAEDPPELARREAEQWNPLLEWAQKRFDIHFEIVHAIIHRAQPPATIVRLAAALSPMDPFQLAAMSPLVTISGSLVTALAVFEAHIDADTGFAITHLDEIWQAEQWGEDHLATEARAARRKDFVTAAAFLGLLRG